MSENCSSKRKNGKKMASSKRSSSSSASAAAIIGGNEDLLIELLLFLPEKPLIKFKAVSKNWLLLISSPSFCRRHTLHHRRRLPELMQHAFIFCNGGSRYHICSLTVPRFFALQLDLSFLKVEILRSCNGLLLLRCRQSSCCRNHYYVFNPTTSQLRDLSPLPFTRVAGIYLMFDPSLSPHYKVVCFVYTKTCTLVYLYDSEIHKWKLRGERIPKGTIFHDGIYFNGGIYFFRFFTSSYRFTLDDNVTKFPPLTESILSCGRKRSYVHSYRARRNYLMEFNGVAFLFSRQETNVLHVYETKEVEREWRYKYEVDMKPFLERGFDIDNNSLLCVIVGEKEEDSMLVFISGGKLMSYRLHGGVFEVLANFDTYRSHGNSPSSFRSAHHFIQSLAPV